MLLLHQPVSGKQCPQVLYFLGRDAYRDYRLFPGEDLHFDDPAQLIRINLVRIAPGEAYLFQLLGVGNDDFLHQMPEQPGKGEGRKMKRKRGFVPELIRLILLCGKSSLVRHRVIIPRVVGQL
jgi:hypothetical protein